MQLSSKAFESGNMIPVTFTADGEDISPPLNWRDVPPEAKSIALICDDPDAPRHTWVHWVLFNLPTNQQELSERIPQTPTIASGAIQGKNDFGKLGYNGPSPPRGKPHRYCFNLFALNTILDLNPGATKADLEEAMAGHIIETAQLIGTYGR